MLRFAEEITLLLLHDDDGSFARVPSWSRDYAIAGSVLMDLAMENRIDTDLENLILLDDTPLGDNLLDPTLAEIAAGEQHSPRFWLEHTVGRAEEIQEAALSRLVEHGILERRDDRVLWVFRARRYPMVDGSAEREVKLRIMQVLFSDEIPDPRDVVLICLADACGIFKELLSRRELRRGGPHRAGAQAGPDRPSDVAGDRRHRDVDRHPGRGAPLLAAVLAEPLALALFPRGEREEPEPIARSRVKAKPRTPGCPDVRGLSPRWFPLFPGASSGFWLLGHPRSAD